MKKLITLMTLLVAIVTGTKADETIASWTFDCQYDKNGESGAVTYTPNSEEFTMPTDQYDKYTFGDSYANIQPTFAPNAGSGTLKAVTGNQWSVGAGYANQCLRLKPSVESTITDFTDAAQHDEYYEATFSTTGYTGITLSMSICYTTNLAADMHVVYSTDGGTTWTDAYTYNTAGSWWGYNSANVSIPVPNQPSVIVRIVRGNGWQDSSKTWNLDYLTIKGSAIDLSKATISFSKPASGVEGDVPANTSIDINSAYTIPTCFNLYKNGYTLTGWRNFDGTIYNVGQEYTMDQAIYEFTPVFEENVINLGNNAAVTVNWTFARASGAPTLAYENSAGYYVQQVSIDGTKYDAAMHINTNKGAVQAEQTGKVNNGAGASYAQVNAYTLFTIPAVKGMTVRYTATNGTPTTNTLGFSTNQELISDADEVNGKVVTYTYNGNAEFLYIIVREGNHYPSGISVDYPVVSQAISTKGENTYASCYTKHNLDFSAVADEITAYIATEIGTNAVKTKAIGKVPAHKPILVKTASPGATVYVPVTTEATDDVSANILKYTDSETPGSAAIYAFFKVGNEYGFAQVQTETKVPVGRCIIIKDNNNSESLFLPLDSDDEATAITNVSANENVNAEAPVKVIKNGKLYIGNYNVAGQRVK